MTKIDNKQKNFYTMKRIKLFMFALSRFAMLELSAPLCLIQRICEIVIKGK